MTIQHIANQICVTLKKIESEREIANIVAFIQQINSAIAQNPGVLTCEVAWWGRGKGDKRPLIEALDIALAHAHLSDASKAQYMWNWYRLHGSELRKMKVQPDHDHYISYRFNKYDLVHRDFVDIDELIATILSWKDGRVLLRAVAMNALIRHFDKFVSPPHLRKSKEPPFDYIFVNTPPYDPIKCQRLSYFINQMRVLGIIDEDTMVEYFDDRAIECQGTNGGTEKPDRTEKALAFLRAQKVDGYQQLRKTTIALFREKLLAALQDENIPKFLSAKRCIESFEKQYPQQAVVVARATFETIESQLNDDIFQDETEAFVTLALMQQAVISNDRVLIFRALRRIDYFLLLNNDNTVWHQMFESACLAYAVPGIDKAEIAEKLMHPLARKCKLTPQEQLAVKHSFSVGKGGIDLGLCFSVIALGRANAPAAEPVGKRQRMAP